MFSYKLVRFLTLPEEDVLGIKQSQTSANPEWRASVSLTHKFPEATLPVNHSLVARAIDGYDCANTADNCTVDMYLTFDYQAVYRTKDAGEITFGIFNLLDEDPPLDNNVVQGDRFVKSLYDARGRYFNVGYRYTF